MAVGQLTFDQFVKNLSGLKSQYGTQKDATGKTNIRNQGIQLRSDALGQGFDLNDLESKAQTMFSGNDTFTPQQENYVQTLHNEAKSLKPTNYMGAGTSISGGGQTTDTTQKNTEKQGQMNWGDEAQKKFQQLESMLTNRAAYDPSTDPIYQSAQVSAQRGAEEASNRTLSDLNRRGISGGSIAQNQLAQIEQGAVTKVQDMIPGLAANFQNGQQNDINNLSSMFSALLGADQHEQSAATQVNQFDKNFGIQEAGVTGNYVSSDTQNIFDQILGNKQAYGSATDVGKKGLADTNKQLYNTLASMGIDPSMIDGKVKYEDAVKNIANFKNPTMNQKEINYNKEQDKKAFDYNAEQDKIAFNYKVSQDEWDNGFKVSQESWSRYADQQRLNDADASRANTTASINNTEAWRKHLKDKDITEANGNKATNGYMTRVLDSKSRDEALNYIYENQNAIVNDGANVDKVLGAINSKWPGPGKEDASGTPSIFDALNK